MIDYKCHECREDEAAIVKWRVHGGAMPFRACTNDHRPTCKCGTKHEGRKSGLCDACWELKKNTANHMISP